MVVVTRPLAPPKALKAKRSPIKGQLVRMPRATYDSDPRIAQVEKVLHQIHGGMGHEFSGDAASRRVSFYQRSTQFLAPEIPFPGLFKLLDFHEAVTQTIVKPPQMDRDSVRFAGLDSILEDFHGLFDSADFSQGQSTGVDAE